MIWLSLLPLTLWESCGWAMLPFALIIAFLLLGALRCNGRISIMHDILRVRTQVQPALHLSPTTQGKPEVPPLCLCTHAGVCPAAVTLVPVCAHAGIEEIGVSIEEPFSILPLCHICGTIQRNVAELLATTAGSNHDLCGQPQGGAVAVPPASLVAAALRGEASSSPAQPWEATGA